MNKNKSINLFEKRKDDRLTEICIFAVMLALEVVLSRFLSFKTFNTKFSFAFIVLVYIARSYGPYKSALFAVLCDIVGATLFPFGPYFFGFTATAGLRGLIWGLFLYERKSIKAILASVITEQFICSLFLNSLWITYLYHTPFFANVIHRLSFQVPAMIVLESAVLMVILLGLKAKSWGEIVRSR